MAFAPEGYYEFQPGDLRDWLLPVRRGHALSVILNREQALALVESITMQMEEDDGFVIVDYEGEMKFDPPEVIGIEGEEYLIA